MNWWFQARIQGVIFVKMKLLLLSQLTAACPLLENNQIWIYCWWLDVLAGYDFKITFLVLALAPCILRRNWIITFKVTRFLPGVFMLHYPLFFPFDIGDKLLLIFLHTSRTRFRSYVIKLSTKISTSYCQLISCTKNLAASIPSCALLYRPVEVLPVAAHSFSPPQKPLVKIHLFYLK